MYQPTQQPAQQTEQQTVQQPVYQPAYQLAYQHVLQGMTPTPQTIRRLSNEVDQLAEGLEVIQLGHRALYQSRVSSQGARLHAPPRLTPGGCGKMQEIEKSEYEVSPENEDQFV